MIERIKSKLSALLKSRRSHLCALALFTAAAIAGATLLDCSIHTIKIFDGKNITNDKTIKNTNFPGRQLARSLFISAADPA